MTGNGLRVCDLKKKYGCSRATVYVYLKDPNHPKPINAAAIWGGKRALFIESEIDAYRATWPRMEVNADNIPRIRKATEASLATRAEKRKAKVA
jgi:predicted DNA-binding transcriptional regulator AlpA